MLREDTRVAAVPTTLSLSHPLARYPGGGFAVDKRGEGGVPREIRERCTATREDVLPAAAACPPSPSSSALSLSLSLWRAFAHLPTFPYLSTVGHGVDRMFDGERRGREAEGRGRIRVSLLRERMHRAVMHWRHVKLSFSHNSLESLPLNLVIGRAIVIRMLYLRLRRKKRETSYLIFWTHYSLRLNSLRPFRVTRVR